MIKAILFTALLLNSGMQDDAHTASPQRTDISLSCNPYDVLKRQNERLKILVEARSLFADAYGKFALKRDQLDELKDEIAQRGNVSVFFRGLKNPQYRRTEIQRLERELQRDAVALDDASVLIRIENQQIDLKYEQDKLRCLINNAPNQ